MLGRYLRVKKIQAMLPGSSCSESAPNFLTSPPNLFWYVPGSIRGVFMFYITPTLLTFDPHPHVDFLYGMKAKLIFSSRIGSCS